MSNVSDIFATLQLLRSEAETLAHRQHLNQSQERIQHLKVAREKVHSLQPVSSSDDFRQAYEISLRRAEIEWLYWAHRQALEQTTLGTHELETRCDELACVKQEQLSALPEPPALSLNEQEALLQALMCQAVEQYVDQAIADVDSAA